MKTSLKKKISVLSSLFDNRKKNFHWSVSIYEKFSHYTRAVTATKCSKKCNESMQSCCAHSETMILLFWYSRCHCCCCLSFYSSLFYVGLFLYTVWPWLFVFIIKVEWGRQWWYLAIILVKNNILRYVVTKGEPRL